MDDDSFSGKSDSETPDLKIPTDGVLIRAFGTSVNLGSEDIAKRVAEATNSKSARRQSPERQNNVTSDNTYSDETQNNSVFPKVGDYVRATYEDGVDYEAKILFLNELDGTCVLRYIGYENEQEARLCDLVPTWGKVARRLQYEQAKSENVKSKDGEQQQPSDKDENERKKPSANSGRRFNRNNLYFENIPAPPPPPMPPMFENASDSEENEHLAAMLMSWYMSGYYTGIYQGMRMNSTKSKRK